jgi:hypothetical protein
MLKVSDKDTVRKTLPQDLQKGAIMISFIMVFAAGVLCGSIIMGLYVAFVNFRDARDNW